MSQLFTSGGQSIGASASASVLPMNIQSWLPFGLTGLISLQSKGFSHIFSSAQFSHSVVSNSLRPHEPQHPMSLSITNSQSLPKPMSIESVMLPTISSSVVPFSSCPQSFPASGSFPRSQFFASGGQSIGASASASVLPMNSHWNVH